MCSDLGNAGKWCMMMMRTYAMLFCCFICICAQWLGSASGFPLLPLHVAMM